MGLLDTVTKGEKYQPYDVGIDEVQIGCTLMPAKFSNFSVYHKVNSTTITGLRGTSANVSNGRVMTHVDFRWILSTKEDFNRFTEIVAQFRATPFLPFKNKVLRRCVYHLPVEEIDTHIADDIDRLVTKSDDFIKEQAALIQTHGKEADRILIAFKNTNTTDVILAPIDMASVLGTIGEIDSVGRFLDAVDKIIEVTVTFNSKDKLTNIKNKMLLSAALTEKGEDSAIFKMLQAHEAIKSATSIKTQLATSEDKPAAATSIKDDNVHLAALNIEWMTTPNLKIGIVAKLQCILFNHLPHISEIRYWTNSGEHTYDLNNCEVFKTYAKNYISNDISNNISTIKNIGAGEKLRCRSTCCQFDLDRAKSGELTSELMYNLFAWEEQKQPVDDKGDITRAKEADRELIRRADAYFERLFKRVPNTNPSSINFGVADEFLEQIVCSLRFEPSILPLQGAQHPTLQFYGRPQAAVELTLHFDKFDQEDSLGTAKYKEIKSLFESIRIRNHSSVRKVERYNPILLVNPLVNMGGMYHFNIEDFSVTNNESEAGGVVSKLVLSEQLLPEIAKEELLNGLVQIEDESANRAFKLNAIIKFLELDKTHASNPEAHPFKGKKAEYLLLKHKVLDQVVNQLLSPEVWHRQGLLHVAHLFKCYETSTLVTANFIEGPVKDKAGFIQHLRTDPLFRDAEVGTLDSYFRAMVNIQMVIEIVGAMKNMATSSQNATYAEAGDLSGEDDPLIIRELGFTDFLFEAPNQLAFGIWNRGLYFKAGPEFNIAPKGDTNNPLIFAIPTLFNIESDQQAAVEGFTMPYGPLAYLSDNQEHLVNTRAILMAHKSINEALQEMTIDEATAPSIQDKVNQILKAAEENPQAFIQIKDTPFLIKNWFILETIEASLKTAGYVVQSANNLEVAVEAKPGFFKSLLAQFRTLFTSKPAAGAIGAVDAKDLLAKSDQFLLKVFTFVDNSLGITSKTPIRSSLAFLVKASAGTAALGGAAGVYGIGLARAPADLIPKMLGGKIGTTVGKSVTGLLTKAGKFGSFLTKAVPPLKWVDLVISPATAIFVIKDKNTSSRTLYYSTIQINGDVRSGRMANMLLGTDEPAVNGDLIKELSDAIYSPYVDRQHFYKLEEIYSMVSLFSEGSQASGPKISTYPDMNLPTYGELAGIVSGLDSSNEKDAAEFERLKTSAITDLANLQNFMTKELTNSKSTLDEVNTMLSALSSKATAEETNKSLKEIMDKLNTFHIVLQSTLRLAANSNPSDYVAPFIISSVTRVVDKVEAMRALVADSTPAILDKILPTFEESFIETPYTDKIGVNPKNFRSRTLSHFVDPGFYIVRQRKNPASYLEGLTHQTVAQTAYSHEPMVGNAIGQEGPINTEASTEDQKRYAATRTVPLRSTQYDQISGTNGLTVPPGMLIDNSRTFVSRAVPGGPVDASKKMGQARSTSAQNILKEIPPSALLQRSKNASLDNYYFQLDAMDRHNPQITENIGSAFPTYAVYFIREVENLKYERHLAADLYLYQNIISLDINVDRLRGHVATITLANIWGTLDNNTFKRTLRDVKDGQLIRKRDIAHRLSLKEMRLQEGMVIEIRHGYSSNPEELHTVFSGKIAEVSGGDIVTVICQGHEHELMNKTRESLDVGFFTGRNMYDYAAQLMMGTSHFGEPFKLGEIKAMQHQRKVHAAQIYDDTGRIGLVDSLLESNLNVSRTTENIWVGGAGSVFVDWFMNDDFVLKDTSALEALHEISRYHFSSVAFPVPFGHRSSMFLGPVHHLYKYTNKYDHDLNKYIASSSYVDKLIESSINLKNNNVIEDKAVEQRIKDTLLLLKIANLVFMANSGTPHWDLSFDRRTGFEIPPQLSQMLSIVFNIPNKSTASLDVGKTLEYKTHTSHNGSTGYIVAPTRLYESLDISTKVWVLKRVIKEFLVHNIGTILKENGRIRHKKDNSLGEQEQAIEANNDKYRKEFNEQFNIYPKIFTTTMMTYDETEALNNFYEELLSNINYIAIVRELDSGYVPNQLEDLLASWRPDAKEGFIDLTTTAALVAFTYYFMCSRIEPVVPSDEKDKIKAKRAAEKVMDKMSKKQRCPPGYKPFREYHSITDKDILINELECTTSMMANEVHVMTPTESTNIWGRTVAGMKDVLGLDPTASEDYWVNNIAQFSIFQSPSEKLIRRIYEPNARRHYEQKNISYRDLAEAMKPMYRGQIVLVGKRSIKPYDVIRIADSYNSIVGDFEVDSVTHSHSMDKGWTTTVTPNLITQHAVMAEDSLARILLGVSMGTVEFITKFLIVRSFIGGAVARGRSILGAVEGETKTSLLNNSFGFLFDDVLKKGIGFSLVGDLFAGARFIIDSDPAEADIWFRPSAEIYGRGLSANVLAQYEEELEIKGAGNTQFLDHLKPVSLAPLLKDGEPWVAGLKGINPYDTNKRGGTMNAVFCKNYHETEEGFSAYKEDIDVWFTQLSTRIKILRRNFLSS